MKRTKYPVAKRRPEDYRHIRAWGRFMQSFEYYIVGEQKRAAEDNAPLDAIYKHSDGHWVRATDIESPYVRKVIDNRVILELD